MPLVIVRRSAYDYQPLRSLVFDLLGRFDNGSVAKNSRVLIKPNLLAPAPPEKAIATHPLVVRATAEYVLEKGGLPCISDSPGMGTFEKVMRESGIGEALHGLPVECRPFNNSSLVDIGPPFGRIEIASRVLDSDVVINLPKLKTHTQMLLTLGVKNTFGCIVGMRKPEWHFRTGIDREKFAELLVRVHVAVRPSITLLDGILAMEGQGPGAGGAPRELGIVMAGNNATAIDAVVCSMLGMEQDALPTNRAAVRLGLFPGHIELDGDLPRIPDMRMPEMTPLVFGPKPLHGFMRKHLVQRPVCDSLLCRHCGECWRYCPAKAIAPQLEGLSFDYDKCIRCYCCIEVCPHAALSATETTLGRVIRRTVGRR